MSPNLRHLASLTLVALLMSACGPSSGDPAAEQPSVPQPDLTEMEPQVRESLERRRSAVLQSPRSADAWGRFGMVAHAHELWAEADIAYEQAEALDPSDERWPYYRGDVLSIVGTDLEAAEQAFRRAIALRANYAPAHMRLGNVLMASDEGEKAALEFERALEISPELQQARVPLAQIRLAEGDLEAAAMLLEEALDHSPKHGQALSTLAQVYMRQGRRDEAREMAGRAREPANYNLFADPVMSKVVAEGVSSVQLWERAKSFLESGNYEQAALGLQRVVELSPDNATAHQQLAVAYGNLGQLESSRRHLESAVALDPTLTNARVQLALLYIEQQAPARAVPHLEQTLVLAPDDPDAGWLLGKVLVLTGDFHKAIALFERATEANPEVPAWAHNEWASALIQIGEKNEGLSHLQAALASEPDNAQALFYVGLLLEGMGREDEAIDYYCRSQGPPASARLQVLGHSCDRP